MAIVIQSENLNIFGNNGRFETDRSTWGFNDPLNKVVSRQSFAKYSGNYGAVVQHQGSFTLNQIILPIKWNEAAFQVGVKFLIRAKVHVPTLSVDFLNPIADDEEIIYIKAVDNNALDYLSEYTVTKTVAEAKSEWVEISAVAEKIAFPIVGYYNTFIEVSGNHKNLGHIFLDDVEVFVVEITDDPEPTCTVDIDEDNTVVTDESAPGANDGSIEGAATGGSGDFEWALSEEGPWQSSNLFSGLGAGSYTLYARDAAANDCIASHVFVVNAGEADFDFEIATTDESVSGANDGSAVITPTGEGSPWTYSKDGGETFQSSNSFSGLAPGEYAFVVKDTFGNAKVKYATINAGAVDVEKVWHSKNPIFVSRTAAAGWEEETNFRLYVDIRVEDTPGTFNSKLAVDLHPRSDGKATFYLNEAFRDSLTLVPPAVNESEITKLTDRIKRFKLFSGSVQGALQEPLEELTESLPSLVVWGGLSKEKFPVVKYFTEYLPTNKKFLTWAPLAKHVDRNQEDYLTFFVYNFFTSLKLQIKAYYEDGTDATEVTKTKTGVKRYELYRIPAGPVNSGATTIAAEKTLVKYELSLLNQADEVISEVRTYYVEQLRHPLTRYFMFVNSLGGEEVLRFTGQAIETTDFNRPLLQKFLPHDYDALAGEFMVNEVTSIKRNSYSSGFIRGHQSADWHAYMEEFLLSPRVYLTSGSTRLPVVITGGEHSIQDQNHERFIRFEAKPAYDNVSFTPKSV